VVNDMRPVRQVVTDILECAGATVTTVDSAEDALDVLQRERPNVLLSDLSMPEGKDGYWLIRQVRALPPERGGTTPAAALTGYTDRPNDRPGHFSPMKLRIGDRFTDADTEDADHEWGRGLAAGHLQAGHERCLLRGSRRSRRLCASLERCAIRQPLGEGPG